MRSICKSWIQNHFCAILGGEINTKQNAVLKQINSYSYCLIVASKPQQLGQALPTGPRRAQIAPKWLQVGLVNLTDLIDVLNVFILTIFKICGSSKLVNLRFGQHHRIKNAILFCKYLRNRKSHINGTVLIICVLISVFRRKTQFENPRLGLQDMKQNQVYFFLGHPV